MTLDKFEAHSMSQSGKNATHFRPAMYSQLLDNDQLACLRGMAVPVQALPRESLRLVVNWFNKERMPKVTHRRDED